MKAAPMDEASSSDDNMVTHRSGKRKTLPKVK